MGESCGADGGGTIFKITARGELTTLYSFCSQTDSADGVEPLAALVQATEGRFYGTTYSGGNGSLCVKVATVARSSVLMLACVFVKTLPTSGKAGSSAFMEVTNRNVGELESGAELGVLQFTGPTLYVFLSPRDDLICKHP